jgi:tRNA modification GTPase
LFNALARREAAIVSDEPGTTRDLLEVIFDIKGLKVRITDTAGLREGAGRVEAIGIERAKTRGGRADLVLVLEDMAAPVPVEVEWLDAPVMTIGTKSDLVSGGTDGVGLPRLYDLRISTISGAGLSELVEEIGRRAAARVAEAGDVLPFRLRHVELLEQAITHLLAAVGSDGAPVELRAEELRLAADRLGRIVGSVDVEDLLDVIFSQFCIGK